MAQLEKYFTEEQDWEGYPKLRFWTSYKERPEVAEVKLELRRPRDFLGFKPAKIYLHFYDKDGKEVHCDHDAWDHDLNSGLMQLGIKAISEENEQERFSLVLRSALRKPENRFGDGYYNSVLTHHIRESEFAGYDEMAEVLKHISGLTPDTTTSAYSDCTEMIDLAIQGRARELTKELGYPQSTASKILVGALARYLDERFSVTNRRLLGMH